MAEKAKIKTGADGLVDIDFLPSFFFFSRAERVQHGAWFHSLSCTVFLLFLLFSLLFFAFVFDASFSVSFLFVVEQKDKQMLTIEPGASVSPNNPCRVTRFLFFLHRQHCYE